MALKTDYKDDIFSGARKYQMVNNPDGTVSFVDVTDYTQEGDYLGSQEVNAITTEINRIPCFKKAEGNGTAIVLTDIELIDGFSITFIASAANNGAATTVNSKPLYKPGTTIAPNLIAGKAVTVWYDSTGDCFFIKASAEGTASVGNVLAGKTFSNDDDTGIVGTMPNRGAKTFTPTDAVQTGDAGYYSGITVNQRPALSGNAVESEILTGKTFYNNNYTKRTGAMPNRGAVSQSLSINGSYTIPAGYHSGSGKVTQSIPTKAAQTYTPGTSNQIIPAGQYLNGAQTIKGDANLIPANILSGKSIFGVAGNVVAGKKFASGTTTSSATLVEVIAYKHSSTDNKNLSTLTVTGIGFTPNIVAIVDHDPIGSYTSSFIAYKVTKSISYRAYRNYPYAIEFSPHPNGLYFYVENGTFYLPVETVNHTYEWYAWE